MRGVLRLGRERNANYLRLKVLAGVERTSEIRAKWQTLAYGKKAQRKRIHGETKKGNHWKGEKNLASMIKGGVRLKSNVQLLSSL